MKALSKFIIRYVVDAPMSWVVVIPIVWSHYRQHGELLFSVYDEGTRYEQFVDDYMNEHMATIILMKYVWFSFIMLNVLKYLTWIF